MAKKYKKGKRSKNGAGLKAIEKNAMAILKKGDVCKRDADNYLVSSSKKGDIVTIRFPEVP